MGLRFYPERHFTTTVAPTPRLSAERACQTDAYCCLQIGKKPGAARPARRAALVNDPIHAGRPIVTSVIVDAARIERVGTEAIAHRQSAGLLVLYGIIVGRLWPVSWCGGARYRYRELHGQTRSPV